MGSQAIWTDPPFRYSAEYIDHIDPDMWSMKGPEIEAAADNYRVQRLLRDETLSAKQANQQARKLAKSICQLLEDSKDLDDLALETIQVWASLQFEGAGLGEVTAVMRKLGPLAPRLERAADENSKAGAPRDEARRRFVYRLAEIWEEVHGEWPRRRHDDQKGRDVGPFYDFVEACDAPFNPAGRGLEDKIRAVIALGKNRHQKPSD